MSKVHKRGAGCAKTAVLLVTLATLIDTATAQTARTLKQCWQQGAASRWCVPADGSSASGNAQQPATGYCCPDASEDEKCIHGDTYQCTLNNKGEMA